MLAPLILLLLIRMAENSSSTTCLISGMFFVIMVEVFDFSDGAKMLLVIFLASYLGSKLFRPKIPDSLERSSRSLHGDAGHLRSL